MPCSVPRGSTLRSWCMRGVGFITILLFKGDMVEARGKLHAVSAVMSEPKARFTALPTTEPHR